MIIKPALLHFRFDGFAGLSSEVDSEVESEVQTDCNGNKWYLGLYPGGQSEATQEGLVGLYLYNDNTEESVSLNTRFSFAVKDADGVIVEGADYEALISLNFLKYRPKVICIEITKRFEESIIFKFLKEKKYILTWSSKSNISHIFIDEENFK